MARVQGRNLYDVIMFSFLIIEIRKWITLINHWHQLTCTQRCQYTNKHIWYKYGSKLLTAWFHTCIVYTATIKWVWEQMSVLTWWRCLLVCLCFMCTLIKQLNGSHPDQSPVILANTQLTFYSMAWQRTGWVNSGRPWSQVWFNPGRSTGLSVSPHQLMAWLFFYGLKSERGHTI